MKLFFLIAISISLTVLNNGCTTNSGDMPELVTPPTELSEVEEINHWIYSQMNHHYLWREDMPDSLSCDFFLTPKEFFESLLSDKDRFSYFSIKSSRSNDSSKTYGFEYQEYSDKNGNRYFQVLYVTSKNASKAGLKRGDFVKVVNIDTEQITLQLFTPRNTSLIPTFQLSFTPDTRARVNETVQIDSVYHLNNKTIGYLCYLEYDNSADFAESFQKFKEAKIEELILDLRYNPGGLVNTCRRLCSMIVPEAAYGKLFQQSSYNNIVASENLLTFGDERTYQYFETPKQIGPTLGPTYYYLNLNRLYVLTSKSTASASESTINSLRPYMDIIVIGENTVGKGVGMYNIESSKFKYSLVPITFRFYNALGETIPDDGLCPDYYIEDGNLTHKKDLGDLNEPLLAKAIELITTHPSFCPTKAEENSIMDYLAPIGEPSFITDFKNKLQINDISI